MVKKMKKWSGIHTWTRSDHHQKLITSRGSLLRMTAKFDRRRFPRSSVILFTEWQNDHITSTLPAEVITENIQYYKYSVKNTLHLPESMTLLATQDYLMLTIFPILNNLCYFLQYKTNFRTWYNSSNFFNTHSVNWELRSSKYLHITVVCHFLNWKQCAELQLSPEL